ncbi:MAG TPA: TIGR03118 family protein [Candidatus Binatia bacterium]|nr:TIGR03118 family protein [Candidatus Binatia bacterium]
MTALSHRFHWRVLASAGVLTLTLGLTLASPVTAASNKNCYLQINLVSDIPGLALRTDPNLVNPWGLSLGPTTFFWVSDNGTGVATLYNKAGQSGPVVVTIPPPAGGTEPSAPTGQVFNEFNATSPSDFVVASGGNSGPSFFIFATEDGTISGWNPAVPSFLSSTAILAVDNSASGAIYKGLAIGSNTSGNFLYAANFSAGTIDVFDGTFTPVVLPPGSFADPNIPDGFAPFNIQNLDGKLYVAYAKQDAAKEDEVAGKGLGFVDVFDTDGNFLERVASRGALNAPWGLALAPANFGRFSNTLLIGNFGDGLINAFSRRKGHFHFNGRLRGLLGKAITIDGLWALTFGKGDPNNGPTNRLFFTAGIEDEEHGLFGSLSACQNLLP